MNVDIMIGVDNLLKTTSIVNDGMLAGNQLLVAILLKVSLLYLIILRHFLRLYEGSVE